MVCPLPSHHNGSKVVILEMKDMEKISGWALRLDFMGGGCPAAEPSDRLSEMWEEIASSAVQVRSQALHDILEVADRRCRLKASAARVSDVTAYSGARWA